MKSKRKRNVVVLLVFILVVCLGAAAYYFLLQKKPAGTAENSSSPVSSKPSSAPAESSEPEEESKGMDLKGMLTDYEIVKAALGEPDKTTRDPSWGCKNYFYGQLELEVYDGEPVASIRIDYSGSNPKDQYCVDGINGTYTPEQLFEELGLPEHDSADPDQIWARRIGYYVDGSDAAYMNIYFDEKNELVFLSYFNPYAY